MRNVHEKIDKKCMELHMYQSSHCRVHVVVSDMDT